MDTKKIELWDGYEVEFDGKLLDDADFASELSEAIDSNDVRTLITMYMALVGGEDTYKTVREHIESEHGYFSMKAVTKLMEKITECFPKSGNRAQRRSWKTSH